MSNKPIIAPSILSADHGRLADEILAVEAAGADWIHIDVMDGHFVPNLTLGPPVIASLRKVTKLPFDVHLMITTPELSLLRYIDAGADRVTVHAEACLHLNRTITQIQTAGALAGVSLNPATPLATIVNVLSLVDLVLLMTVNPGFGGQSFIESVVPKINALRALLLERKFNVHVEVDGGIAPDTIATVSAAGANAFVAGAAIFKKADYRAEINALRSVAKNNPFMPPKVRPDYSLV